MIKKDPVKMVLWWAILGAPIAFVFGISVVSLFSKLPIEPLFIFLLFAVLSWGLIQFYLNFIHIQKRIDALEEKLNEQNSPKE